MQMGLKPLGVVKEIVESVGIGIAYAYDDLVFVDHNAFILQFSEQDNEMLWHLNVEANESEVEKSIGLLNVASLERDIVIKRGRYYSLAQTDDENVRLEFVESKK